MAGRGSLWCLWASAAIVLGQPGSHARVTTPEDHNAKRDGVTDDSHAVWAALRWCQTQHPGACRVDFARTYLTGPFKVLSSGVTLNQLNLNNRRPAG